MSKVNEHVLERIKRVAYLRGSLDTSVKYLSLLKSLSKLSADIVDPELERLRNSIGTVESEIEQMEQEINDFLSDVDVLISRTDRNSNKPGVSVVIELDDVYFGL